MGSVDVIKSLSKLINVDNIKKMGERRESNPRLQDEKRKRCLSAMQPKNNSIFILRVQAIIFGITFCGFYLSLQIFLLFNLDNNS